jgi:phosphatidate cytidylyltransferase
VADSSSVSPPAAAPKKPSDLIPRVIVAVIGVPALLAIAFLAPNAAVWALLAGAATIGTWEYVAMTLGKPLRVDAWAAVVGTALLMVCSYWVRETVYLHSVASFVVMTLMVLCMRSTVETREVAARFGHLVAGVVYSAVLFGALISMTRADDPWAVSPTQAGWLLLPMMIIWAGDTGAYFAGRAFGRRKLAPRLSPAKTWEGAIGGTLASVGGGFLGWALLPLPAELQAWQVVAFALPGAIIGQVGDLAESLIKRSTGVKDSSRILYGHGGMLDRTDALIFAAPWFALLKELFALS